MDGVFMWKILKRTVLLLLVAGMIYTYFLYRDQTVLSEEVLRFHVVADSDEAYDQNVKLEVRDAVLSVLDGITKDSQSKEEVMAVVKENLSALEAAANDVLKKLDAKYHAAVSLEREEFPTRDYETFRLPSGVYDSLRVTIGSGEGKNWWCVAFPELCLPAASAQVEEVAAGAGFSHDLGKTLTREKGYEVRFWLLDCLGKLQNFFHME